MDEVAGNRSGVSGLRGVRRRAVAIHQALVTAGPLAGIEGPLPLLLQTTVENVDLAGWAADNRDTIETHLAEHGALLFRGFGLRDVHDFERAASALGPDLFGDYGDLPREADTDKIYSATPYPADKWILFHNESSHLPRWPMRQFFFCVVPAAEGGETPVVDCHAICSRIDPDVFAEFEAKRLMYVRNFLTGIDVRWQDFFKTDSRAQVERSCADSGMEWDWRREDQLTIRQVSPAVRVHPGTGEPVFFNQVQLHHAAGLDPDTRAALETILDPADFPRSVLFGDGSPIPNEFVDHLVRVYTEHSVAFRWEAGDILMLDNMLVAHGRRPYTPPRKIVVAMAGIVGASP